MELVGERLVEASLARTWAALNDPEVLRRSVPGCDSLEQVADDHFTAHLSLRIGPVSAKFKGDMRLIEVDAPNGYRIDFEGQGGVAGFGRGFAQVRLAEEGAHTRLRYRANATVGGKIAQVGSRLVDATAAKLAEDFFKRFQVALTEAPVVAPGVGPVEAAGAAAGAVSGAARVATAPAAPAAGKSSVWPWLVGAAVVLWAAWQLLTR